MRRGRSAKILRLLLVTILLAGCVTLVSATPASAGHPHQRGSFCHLGSPRVFGARHGDIGVTASIFCKHSTRASVEVFLVEKGRLADSGFGVGRHFARAAAVSDCDRGKFYETFAKFRAREHGHLVESRFVRTERLLLRALGTAHETGGPPRPPVSFLNRFDPD